MKKFYASLVLLCLYNISICSAQQLQLLPKGQSLKKSTSPLKKTTSSSKLSEEKCGYNMVMENAIAKGFNNDAFESKLTELVAKKKASIGNERFAGIVTIPVVFHVIHQNETLSNATANLTAAKIQAQLNQLNLDYGNLSGSTYAGIAADVRIRFCLAVVDTVGRPLTEPGINRINAVTRTPAFSVTNSMTRTNLINYFENTIKPSTIWDPNSYMNVWLAAMDASSLLGYATFPSLSGLPGLDAAETNTSAGVVINWKSVGSVASPGVSSVYGYGRTLTHEAGHFFGLRHIWGDATCGTDYCNDTPPQYEETTGCPTVGTLNNCTPSGPKMFQNYMDYSYDACLNTFTNDQAFRSQAVMDNSPRRRSLINSKACVARPGNAISFNFGEDYSINESSSTGPTVCPRSSSYTFRIYPSVQATGAATVTFTTSESTATPNVDFSISPASVTFANNESAPKTITVTVFDNQNVETVAKKIVIGYTITGTGVVAGPDKQKLTINIIDDEKNVLEVDNANPFKAFHTQNFDASANIPTGWTTQTYSDGNPTPNTWVVGANGGAGTTNNSAYITNNITTKPNTYNNTITSDAYLFTPLIDASNFKQIALRLSWKSLGEAGYDAGYIGYIPEGIERSAENVLWFDLAFYNQSSMVTNQLTLPESFSGSKFYFVFNWENDESAGASPGFTIDNVSFYGRAFEIATARYIDTTFTFNTNQTIYMHSISPATAGYRLITKLSNSNQNIGCINASITREGSSILTTVETTSGVFQCSEKVISIKPTVANSTANYQATFYYTAAELANWGTNVPNLKILKVKDGVDVFSTINASDATLYTPTVDDQRATKGYASYTINATGGFSQFLLVSPLTVLPVLNLDFTAKATQKNIMLNWSTSAEINNKGFAIERSTDGIHFDKIDWVNGANNSSSERRYLYVDNYVQPNVLYYYRLAQTDNNNSITRSDIKQAIVKATDIQVMISPNPATDYLKVFISGTEGLYNIKMFNAQGSEVRSWSKLNLSTPNNLNISGVAKGVYMLRVQTTNRSFVKKIIVQ